MSLNREALDKHLEYLRKDHYDREFYIALLLYDVLGLRETEITQEDIDRVYDLYDEYDSIYNEDLRERLIEEREEQREEEIERDDYESK